ncbi:MAG: Gfo/Idh/MocA family oxidoreductase [Candidatus Omnitrophica bacterium]|nr:Gfo/Idh/MocA family oxidoreductase [Candidatus Omnitrophota bacterium]
MSEHLKALLIGLGGFGKNHLKAWCEMGFRERIWVAELDAQRHAECWAAGLRPAQVTTDHRKFLGQADLVDIVTPSSSHFQLCAEALEAGKDVFVEKPMTMNSEEALRLSQIVSRTGRILQVGYYYRFHPVSLWIREELRRGTLGELRYLSGKFLGFKRARTDVGVTHTDAIHFFDLINWLLGTHPTDVFAVTRDHFGRGLEDLSVALLTYPKGILAHVESGYIQPGRWNDRVVPNAKTTKELILCGSEGTLQADFETSAVELFKVRHVLKDGIWQLVNEGSIRPTLPLMDTVGQVRSELEAFLRSASTRGAPAPNVLESGLHLAQLMETLYLSSKERRVIELEPKEVAG